MRARGKCEFCGLRPGAQIHHRWYGPDAYTGNEPEESVMMVCRPCHRLIHGLIGQVKIQERSLADYGDRGMGKTRAWKIYLSKRERA